MSKNGLLMSKNGLLMMMIMVMMMTMMMMMMMMILLKVIPLSEPGKAIKNIQTRDQKSTLKDLTPGATYEIQLYSVYEQKESTAYISTNFTTKPNTPGRFIVWFRNETTLLVLWQPPYPAGYYTDYKVIILCPV